MLLYKKVYNIKTYKYLNNKNLNSLFIFVSLCLLIYETETSSVVNDKTTRYLDSSKVEFCEKCDLFIGGLFPIHGPKYARQSTISPIINFDENSNLSSLSTTTNVPTTSLEIIEEFFDDFTCGDIKKERGIQRLEAMLFAIDLINNSTSLLPNIKLGARIYDTCDRDTIAMEKCINFVSDYFLLKEENIVNDFTCVASDYALVNSEKNNHMKPSKNKDAIHKRKVVGVIGAASSSVSIQVANLLRLFQVPQISYASTSPELSNKERFPFFSRVLPSDTLQAEAMANLVHHLNWNYIATLNEEGNLGGIDSFITNAKSRNICISGSYTISQTASEDDVKLILTEMYKQKNARGVVVFLQDHNIRKLLKIVNGLNMTGHFLWIASDSWGTKKESISSNDLAAQGAITFSPKSFEIKEFNEYFQKLRPRTNTRNPWFEEFWQDEFKCLIGQPLFQPNHRRLYKKQCTGEEKLNITQDGFIHFVIDSVFAMAHAIQDLISTHCSHLKHTDLIKCQQKIIFKGPEFLKAIRNVNFDSVTGRRVEFLKNSGDGLAPFEVFQYQQFESGKFGYKKITEWEKNKPFVLDTNLLKWNLENRILPRSICKEECGYGEIKQGDHCCWVCTKCEENEYVNRTLNKCIKCEQGYGPDENKTKCLKLDIEYMTFNSPFTIIPITFSTMGIFITMFTIYVFIRYNETPIIKASGRELCYVLLAGIMSSYLVTFPMVTKPTFVSCLMLRFGFSTSLTLCLSALFTKTNRLSRIFNNSVKQVRQASYVSPKSQLFICGSIVSVQVIGILVWISINPPSTSFDYDDPKRVILQCNTQNTHLAISFLYNFFLVILCTIYAVKTRKIPENFNEARFIGFTMYSICIIWVAFIPIYFGTTAAAGTSKSPKNNYKIQLTTMAMCLSLSATVILFCLFLPKLRVVILKPNKNVRTKSNISKLGFKNNTHSYKESAVVLQSMNNHGNFEKSLTVATVASTNSTPSSPGSQMTKQAQYLNTFQSVPNKNKFSNSSIKTSNFSSSMIEQDYLGDDEKKKEEETRTKLVDLEDSDKVFEKDVNNNYLSPVQLAITQAVESLGEFSIKVLANQINDDDKSIQIKKDTNEYDEQTSSDYEYFLVSRGPDRKSISSINNENLKTNDKQLINDSDIEMNNLSKPMLPHIRKGFNGYSKNNELSASSTSLSSQEHKQNSNEKIDRFKKEEPLNSFLVDNSTDSVKGLYSLKITFV
ncbi:unnamed protein product [Brachionus calyciflorus]|uniref:G-protein coupled receptors family 3 profile domain-containing protein n=1 Tax=Brachionus calyciflorus TaxID=104777 RepID=A0A814AWX2_9BILA|nr:unnamed protein product [Brachionus calyciflorus]